MTSRKIVYLIAFSLVAVFLVISCLISLAPAKADSPNFKTAFAATSGLVPATKPFSARTAFAKTNHYTGLVKLSTNMQSQVKKKVVYDKTRYQSVKKNINTRIANTSKMIQNRSNQAIGAIQAAADARLEILYTAADEDYAEAASRIMDEYDQKTLAASDWRVEEMQKIEIQLENKLAKISKSKFKFKANKRMKKAARKLARTKALKRFRALKKKQIAAVKKKALQAKEVVIAEYAEKIRKANEEMTKAEEVIDKEYSDNLNKADTSVMAEQAASNKALDAATKKERELLASQKAKLQKLLNTLSKNKAGKLN